jgi:hypothetical protein
MPFKNSQWAVTKYGLETRRPEATYGIKASELALTTDRSGVTFYEWPVHMAEKSPWINITAFIEAFIQALEFHKSRHRSRIDNEMLQASIVKARHINKHA